MLPNVSINILPGPVAPFLLGQFELSTLCVPGLWGIVEKAVTRYNSRKKSTARDSACSARDLLEDWRKRRVDLAKDEVDSLEGLDSLFAHGGPEPTENKLRKSVEDIIVRAVKNGCPPWYAKDLRKCILVDNMDVWRNVLGKDPAARIQPMVINIKNDPKTGLPMRFQRVTKRSYGKAQQDFLDAQIKRMLANGILVRSMSPWACPPYIPFTNKSGGKKMRFCVDCRSMNRVTEIIKPAVLPLISEIMKSQAGNKYFCTLDGTEGFFQAPLHPESYKYASILLDETYSFTRTIMGQVNSGAFFQYNMRRVLEGTIEPVCHTDAQRQSLALIPQHIKDDGTRNLFKHGITQYMDDGLIAAPTLPKLLQRIRWYIERCRLFSIFLKPLKANLFCLNTVFCGWNLSECGIRVASDKYLALSKVRLPVTAGELQHWISSLLFLKSKLPNFSKIVKPLQDLLNVCLAGTNRSKRQASKLKLSAHNFGPVHVRAFMQSKKMLKDAVCTSHYKQDGTMHLNLFCDASQDSWGCMLSQCPIEDIEKPVLSQRHEPLAFLSGVFRKASSRWSIVSKEAASILFSVRSLKSTLLNSAGSGAPGGGFTIWTDHANLSFIMAPSATRQRAARSTMDRLERWSWEIASLPYRLKTLKSCENVVADLLSRWGAEESKVPNAEARACLVNPKFAFPPETSKLAPALTDGHRRAVAKKRAPSASWEVPKAFEWPSKSELIEAQKHLSEKEISISRLEPNGLRYIKSKIIIPQSQRDIQIRICIVGHAGSAGHRGYKPTLASISNQFNWKGLRDTVTEFMRDCLQCLKTRSGRCIPLVWGSQVRAEAPAEVVHIDHLFIQSQSISGHKYILVLKCGFSHVCKLIPTFSTDTAPVVQSILDWIATHGLMTCIVTDGPSTMKNSLMKALTSSLGLSHHIVQAYTPWSTGAVERHNRECLKIFRAILSESGPKWNLGRWPELCPQVQFALNTTHSDVLGCSPLEAFTGRKPKSPIDLLAFHGHVFKEIETCTMPTARVLKHVAKLREILKDSSDRILKRKNVKRERNNKGRTPASRSCSTTHRRLCSTC